MIDILQRYGGSPTFFIPAVVLRRHPRLMADIARSGTEIGLHGYVHNDYRLLSWDEQYEQTRKAALTFKRSQIVCQGVRNPYLGWTEESLHVYKALGLDYESNEAVLHEIIGPGDLHPLARSGYEKSLDLYRALPCNAYTLRPHFEDSLLRIPLSIPDDEMLLDRLRMAQEEEVGRIWSAIMQRVYATGGLYTLNLHPERAVLCQHALAMLLTCAREQPLPVWIARLCDIAEWWQERSRFRITVTPLCANLWLVDAACRPRATLLARHLTVEDAIPTTPWVGSDVVVHARHFSVHATHCPVVSLSPRTPDAVCAFLYEQGYPVVRRAADDGQDAVHLDLPEGLGTTRAEQVQRCGALLDRLEQVERPLIHFGCWPNGQRAALAISGDIDSITIQDFFLRVLEFRQHTSRRFPVLKKR